jgi:hypothetical protein
MRLKSKRPAFQRACFRGYREEYPGIASGVLRKIFARNVQGEKQIQPGRLEKLK